MEIKQLECFYTLAQTLNFTRAAETLYISQPAMSYQISLLENELDTELFVRNKRQVSLTAAGAAIIPLVSEILTAINGIPYAVRQAVETTEPLELKIGLDSTEDHFEFTGITAKIAAFMQSNPDVTLETSHLPLSGCVDKLLDHSLDIAFLVLRYEENLPSNLSRITVHRDNLELIIKDDPEVHTAIEALTKYPLIAVSERPAGLTRMMHLCDKLGVPHHCLTVDSIPASFAYMQAGKGSIILPGIYFKNHDYKGLKCFEIDDESMRLTHVLAWNSFRQNPAIQKMVNSFQLEK